MQGMHKSTNDRPLTGVHWPIHRGWCRASGTKGDLSTSTGGTHRGAGWGWGGALVYICEVYTSYLPINRYWRQNKKPVAL